MVTVGIDEVGRGCWAGPLVAGAVILKEPIQGLMDSKIMSKSLRDKFSILIQEKSLAYGLGWVGPSEIDKFGLTEAVRLAMARALSNIQHDFDEMIIDGNINFFAGDARAKAVIKADGSVPAVSAASIIAKVARDNYMAGQAHEQFPEYEFDRHVGYGTALHIDKLKEFGVSPLHRRSYKPIKALMDLA